MQETQATGGGSYAEEDPAGSGSMVCCHFAFTQNDIGGSSDARTRAVDGDCTGRGFQAFGERSGKPLLCVWWQGT
jgi:hypothetical protein